MRRSLIVLAALLWLLPFADLAIAADPPAEELAALVETDRKLIALIEAESQRAFERVQSLVPQLDTERPVPPEHAGKSKAERAKEAVQIARELALHFGEGRGD